MKITFKEMTKLCEQKEEFRAKREVVNGVPVVIFAYMVAFTETFNSELAKEFRGTTFREDTKELISRPLPKFFNVCERPETQPDQINWKKASYYTKHDGSMAIPVSVNGKIFWKTKKSFYSTVAKKIQALWDRKGHVYLGHNCYNESMLNDYCAQYTPIFEYVGPTNQIVLPYEEEKLIFLGSRHNETGDYLPSYQTYCPNVTYESIAARKDIEGFVIRIGQQLMKAKTNWYLERHKVASEFNPKAVIQATLDESIDDIIAMIYQLGLPERAKQVEQLRDETLECMIELKQIIDCNFHHLRHFVDDRKLFAEKVNTLVPNDCKGFMFMLLDEKDIQPKLNELVFNYTYASYKTN